MTLPDRNHYLNRNSQHSISSYRKHISDTMKRIWKKETSNTAIQEFAKSVINVEKQIAQVESIIVYSIYLSIFNPKARIPLVSSAFSFAFLSLDVFLSSFLFLCPWISFVFSLRPKYLHPFVRPFSFSP